MNFGRHPDLIDRLAAQYALGVMRGGARRRFEVLARTNPAIRAAITGWQGRLAGLAELQPAHEPVDKVWCGIEQRLGWQPVPAPAVTRWRRLWHAAAFWRGTTLAALVLAAVAVGINVRMTDNTDFAPIAGTVGVLNDDRAQVAALVVWNARTRVLMLRRVDHLALTDAQALQLWALAPDGKPHSLGVIGHARAVRLTVPPLVAGTLAGTAALAISVEPRGGSPDPAGPTGPVVFTGKIVDATL